MFSEIRCIALMALLACAASPSFAAGFGPSRMENGPADCRVIHPASGDIPCGTGKIRSLETHARILPEIGMRPGEARRTPVHFEGLARPFALQRHHAQYEDNQFSFRVCNKSRYKAYVAISYNSLTSDDWIVEGWWTVDRGDCKDIGNFEKGNFYFYANSQSGEWDGKSLNLCVELPGPFKRINRSNYQCQSREKLVGFSSRNVSNSIFTWNLFN